MKFASILRKITTFSCFFSKYETTDKTLKFAQVKNIYYLCRKNQTDMKKLFATLLILVCYSSLASAVSYIYNGRSTYSSDILFTWDGKYLYNGRSTYSSDIILTFDGKYIYKGRSSYSSDIIATWDGKYLYQDRSTYSSDIILTWDGTYIYKGRSTYSSDILYTFDKKYAYKGRSTYSNDILCTVDGPIPVAVMMIVLF